MFMQSTEFCMNSVPMLNFQNRVQVSTQFSRERDQANVLNSGAVLDRDFLGGLKLKTGRCPGFSARGALVQRGIFVLRGLTARSDRRSGGGVKGRGVPSPFGNF